MEDTKEVTTTANTDVGMPVDMVNLEQDSALGGNISLQDISIPYLYILQGNSPQTNPDHPKYIDNAKAGMLYLTNIEKVFDGRDAGLIFVPCFYERLITEWKPRESGGGLVAYHPAETELMLQAKPNEKGQLFLPNGHQVIETAYHYFIVRDPSTGTWYQTIAPFKSTALKASRKMNSQLSTTNIPNTDKRAPRFLYKWLFKTTKEQKDDYVWSSPKFEMLDMCNASEYSAARAFAVAASKGLLRRAAVESEMDDIAPAKAAKPKLNPDDEIPF